MIPGWKVKREVLRFRQQIAWYWESLNAGRRTRQHDRDRPRLVTRHDGPRNQGPRIAALLIFQPGDMPASLLESCDQLTDLGYSVLVVSNGPLSAAGRAALLPHVWRLLERPNLGYDFGGYREAVMHLWDAGVTADELLVLNDSVWLVQDAFAPFLDRLAQMEADVTGTVLRSKKGKHWLESYFFRFNRTALSSSAFRDFWRHYRLVDSKFGVIRQGERDFTVKLAAGGLRIGSLGDSAGFLARMSEAPDEELILAMRYGATVEGGLAEDRARLLGDSTAPHWRTRVIAHLETVLDGRRVWNSQFPIAARRVMTFPFLKKSREPVNQEWRRQVLAAIEAGVFPSPTSSVLTEIRERLDQGTTQTPHWMARSNSVA